jgi:hypothetical protein
MEWIMKNTQQDRFEKKLIRFINDVDKGWKRDRAPDANISDYLNYRDEKMKEYGFTEEEWEKACRLIRSWTSEETGSKKTKRYDRKKIQRDRIKDITKSDNADNVNGEMELKAIDDWIADVYDN